MPRLASNATSSFITTSACPGPSTTGRRRLSTRRAREPRQQQPRALRRLLPFAFHGHCREGRGGVKGSLGRAKPPPPCPPPGFPETPAERKAKGRRSE